MLCALPSICVVMLSGLIPGNSGHKMLSSSFGWVTAIPDIPGIFGRFFFLPKRQLLFIWRWENGPMLKCVTNTYSLKRLDYHRKSRVFEGSSWSVSTLQRFRSNQIVSRWTTKITDMITTTFSKVCQCFVLFCFKIRFDRRTNIY